MSRKNNTYKTTTFIGMLRINKISNLVFKSFSFYLSCCVTIVFFYYFKGISLDKFKDLREYITTTLPPLSASLLGIIIAGLAIIVALSAGRLNNILLEENTLHKLLFPFWYTAVLWAVLTLLAFYFNFIEFSRDTLFYMILIIIFLFNYAMFGTISLIGNSIRIMIYIAKLKG